MYHASWNIETRVLGNAHGQKLTKSEAEIRNFQVSGSRNQEVVGFDVAMNPFQSMSFLDTQDHLSDVPSGNGFRKNVIANKEA